MRGLILIDDGGGSLGPLSDLRASFDLRTGPLTTEARLALQSALPVAARVVPSELQALVQESHPGPVNALDQEEGTYLLINGRLPRLGESLPAHGTIEIDEESGAFLRGTLDGPDCARWIADGCSTSAVPANIRTVSRTDMTCIRYPWEVLDAAASNGQVDLDLADGPACTPPDHATILGHHSVHIASGTSIDPGTVLDARNGPILLGQETTIGANAVLVGPCSVGDGSIVAPHAHLKAGTVIGPRCRVGGEIGGTVFQGHANKAHHGHLGDSWVGEWANLGAGTVNSNLLNTYGEVPIRLDPDEPSM
ncbi:MAG: hypothetical protein MK085_13805, partial [Phycisphaerales bacterium]|nr:hypothetical protein [Phycisphaerales bacterium]